MQRFCDVTVRGESSQNSLVHYKPLDKVGHRRTHGDGGRKAGSCPNRAESSPLNDKSKSLVLVNYFRSTPIKPITCEDNSGELINMLQTCFGAAGNRWANFVAVDYYKRSEGGGSFQAVDTLNGKLLCGCDDVHTCVSIEHIA
ncbi:hypothetical protein JHK82_051728 [Glycine max]|nr:hypothetical protein JHK82_051728 [Glycine max]